MFTLMFEFYGTFNVNFMIGMKLNVEIFNWNVDPYNGMAKYDKCHRAVDIKGY